MEVTSGFSKKMIECSLIEKSIVSPCRAGDRGKAKPEWDRDRCVKCGMCYVYCPDGAVYRMEDGFFDVEDKKCKSCGICHRECWFGVISMVEEE